MNTGNRVLWAILGLVLLALGVAGALASLDRLPGVDADSSVLPSSLDTRWREAGFWAPLVSIVAGVVLVGLGYLLLRAQLRRRTGPSTSALVLPDIVAPVGLAAADVSPAGSTAAGGHSAGGYSAGGGGTEAIGDAGSGPALGPSAGGRTRIASSTLAKALSDDLAADRLVESATAQLTGTADDPWVRLRLAVTPDADLDRLRGVVDGALTRFAATSGLRPRLADVEVKPGSRPLGRVA